MTTVTLDPLFWKTFPKSIRGGVNVIAFTVNTVKRENLTGRT